MSTLFQDILNLPLENQLWFLALFFWTLFWKGMGMWKAAREGSKPWFIGLLLINTMGILEILYIYVIAPKKSK